MEQTIAFSLQNNKISVRTGFFLYYGWGWERDLFLCISPINQSVILLTQDSVFCTELSYKKMGKQIKILSGRGFKAKKRKLLMQVHPD